MKEKTLFFRYVAQNIFGMLGLSFYILADTFFISKAQGANGITALNLVLPMYSLLFAIGAMIGIGSAIRYTISKTQGKDNCDHYFFHALLWAFLISIPFILVGLFFPGKLLALLGADEIIVMTGTDYTRIFMLFAPLFMWNHICNAFVRNDGGPTIAMLATLISSLFNVLMDYILMFPLQMGMSGAALATALSPVLGIMICCIHIFSKKNHIRLVVCRPKISLLFHSCQVGISAFVGEISSGVITMSFNYLILKLAGNTGVAAYGIVANCALVGTSIFNGVAQGSQPLISSAYGKGNPKTVNLLRKLSFITAFILAVCLYLGIYLNASPIAGLFNGEQNPTLQKLAETGLCLYFIGFFFSGINIVGCSYFSATAHAKEALVISILRGFILILLAAFLLSDFFGMTGVWLAYGVCECITALVLLGLLHHIRRSH